MYEKLIRIHDSLILKDPTSCSAELTLMPCEFAGFQTSVKIPFFWGVPASLGKGQPTFETTCVPVTQGDIPEETGPQR